MKIDRRHTPHTKINSRWKKNLNIYWDTLKVLDETIDSKISDIPCSNNFTDMSPRARDIKARINEEDYKLKALIYKAFFFYL